jgi:hypothetical protein
MNELSRAATQSALVKKDYTNLSIMLGSSGLNTTMYARPELLSALPIDRLEIGPPLLREDQERRNHIPAL